MCGFVTFINHGNKELLKESTELISHRGPDNQSIFWDENFNSGLGHRRLSIIDLSEEGNQPMWSDDQQTAILFNGEIFNFLELKKEFYRDGVEFRTNTDTEVLLKGYQKYGEKILNKLIGMYSFVIYEKRTGNIFGARDHIGIKPFYYFHKNDTIIIASEIKSILNALGNVEADFEALASPMHFQTAPQTGFKGIKKLEPGHFLEFRKGKINLKQYWSILKNNEIELIDKDFEESLDFLLNDSIEKQMISDVPIGVLLSGGLDSSLIAAIMSKNTNKSITSFNIRIKENDLSEQGIVDDSQYARKVAKQFSFNHKEITIDPKIIDLLPKLVYHLEELTVDPAAINTFLISKAAKESGISVLLSGIGADEVFSGYRIHLALNTINKLGAVGNNKLVKNMGELFSKISGNIPLPTRKHTRWFKKILYLISIDPSYRHVLGKDASLDSSLHSKLYNNDYYYNKLHHIQKEKILFEENNLSSYLKKICLSDSSIYLPDHNLQYLDKATMAASIEARPPLIDRRIVKLAFKMPDNFRIKSGKQKYILKKIAKKYLDDTIINRPKAPFAAPLRGWVKNDLKEMIFDNLSENTIKKRGVFNYKYVSEILHNHNNGFEDNSQLIFRLLMTEIWFSTFIDK